MKFDLVFSNPPYNSNIDIKILNEIIDISDEFIVVHPSTWLIDRQNLTQTYVDFKSKITGKTQSVELFNGNPLFNIKLFVPCLIIHINKKYDGLVSVQSFNENYISNLEDITIFGSRYTKIVKPFVDTLRNLETLKTTFSMDKKFKVQLAVIRGNVENKNVSKIVKDDFYTIVMQNSDENKGIRLAMNRKDDARLVFSFHSESEQNNFLSYLKTDFVRFCLAMYKVHSNQRAGALNLIPWLDFTEEWDDDKLFKKFNVSQDLQDYIKDFLPDYYGIRK